MVYFAHTDHDLDRHLRETGEKAAVLAASFGAGAWVELGGIWHDLGKYRPGFQRYLAKIRDGHAGEGVAPCDKTHSAAGALLAMDRFGVLGRVLAHLVSHTRRRIA